MTIREHEKASKQIATRLDELRAAGIWGENERIREYGYEVLARRQEPEEYVNGLEEAGWKVG